MKNLPILALVGLIATQASFAASAPQNLPAEICTPTATYFSGGIGKAESTAIEHVANQYPLEMEFLVKAKPHDEYTANVQVKVVNNHNVNVIDTTAQGPFLLAKIPNGAYRIEATENGVIKVRHVVVNAATPKSVAFVWNA